MRWFFIYLVVLASLTLIFADDEKKSSVKEKSAAKESASNSNSTVKAKDDHEDKKKDETPKIKICDKCKCAEKIIDCSNRTLNNSVFDYEYSNGSNWKTIDFSYNNISHVKQFPAFEVNVLILSHNNITEIDRHSFKNIKNLMEIDLSHNHLARESLLEHGLAGRFSEETYQPLNLRKLNLSYNDFTLLNSNTFEHVIELRSLDLSYNRFGDRIDKDALVFRLMINQLVRLEELYMRGCRFKNLDASLLSHLRHLKLLDISYNEFNELPHVLEDVDGLETLILDGNPIGNLTEYNGFPLMKKLKFLSMSNMTKLATIGNHSMSNLTALEDVVIEHCPKFTYIDGLTFAIVVTNETGSTTWPRIKTLNLTNNALKYLPSNLVASWDDVLHMHLLNNNWVCNCDNQYLIGTILPQYGSKLMGNETNQLTCSAPPEHHAKTLPSLSKRHLRCLDAYGAEPERDSAVLVGMFVGVLLAVPLVLAMFVLWKRGYFFCGSYGPGTFSRAFYRRTSPFDDDDM